jgi:hypothetical protein
VPALFALTRILTCLPSAAQRGRQPLARGRTEPVAHPNLCDAQPPELAARSASRLHAMLGGLCQADACALPRRSSCGAAHVSGGGARADV